MTIPAAILNHARRLRARTRRLVEGQFAGHYLSVFKGTGVEFAEVREYVPGDDIRAIDWNVTARSGRVFIKRHVEERNLTVLLAVDMSGSTAFGSAGSAKRERAAEIAMALAVAALGNGDRVGLVLFTNEVERCVAPQRGRNTALGIASTLLAFEPKGRHTSIDTALRFLRSLGSRRCLVFLLSDFIDEDDYEQALRGVAARHDLVPVWLHDRHEMALPDVGLVALGDLESGEQVTVDTGNAGVRAAYRASRSQASAELVQRFRRLGLDHVRVDLEADWVGALTRFFDTRARRLEAGR